MKLQKALEALVALTGYDKLTLQEKLNGGSTLVSGRMIGGQRAIKYVWRVKGNILYTYKLSDSTPDHIILTLEQAAKMIPGIFSIVYDQYLSKQDFILEDTEHNLADTEENLWGQTDSSIVKLIEENDILVFDSGWNK